MADRRQHKRAGRGRRAQRLGERVAEDGGWGTTVRPRLVNSRPASLFLGGETSGGAPLVEHGVGPGLWVTHRRLGRYIAAVAPGLALRGGHRNQSSRGKQGRRGRKERGKARGS